MHFMTGIPRRYARFDNFEFANNFTDLNKFISIAAAIVFVIQLLFVVNMIYSAYRGRKLTSDNLNPYGATSLEWTTPAEHFHGNWAGELPTVYRWPYDYHVNGKDFIPQTEPLAPGEISHS
jgi:cytochrome c oxidase subunit 1